MSTWVHTHLPRLRAGETPDVLSVKVPGQHVEYAAWVSLKDVTFKVHEHGRQRCITSGVRNVHAWVVGEEILRVRSNWAYAKAGKPVGYRKAVYDPWKGRTFVDSVTLEPVLRASLVIMSGKNVYYVPSKD